MLDAALAHARRGWPVFPLFEPVWLLEGEPVVCSCGDGDCANIGKHPRTRRGFKDATTDEGEIRKAWEASPTANIGVPTGAVSGMVVLDIDPRHGGDDSLEALEAEYGKMPHTVEQLTGGGGRHLCFRHPGGTIRNKVGVRPGIDIRGDGGYIVVEPSLHASGRRYAFELSSLPGEVDLAEMPKWLLDLLSGPGQGDDGGRDPAPVIEGVIAEGRRDDTLTSLAGTMRRRGMSESAIAAALQAENRARCRPPLDDDQVTKIARNVAKYPPAVEIAEDWSPPLPLVNTAAAPPFPIETAFPPGLEEIRRYAEGLAREIQVPVDLPCMLIPPIVSATIAQKFTIEIRGRWRETTPIWTMTVLDSGERKSGTLRRLTDPVHEWERDEAERLRPLIAEEQERREIMEKERTNKRRAAGEGDADAEARALELARQLAELSDREAPSLVITDATSEAIVEMMVGNGERALVATPEADAFDVMMGRYSEGQPNLGIWLSGYSGDRVRVRRRGNKTSYLDRPHLCVAASVQPEAVRGLLGNRVARGRGLLARYCWSVPRGMVGRREVGAPCVDERYEMAYVTAIRRLLQVPLDLALPPRVIRLSPEALELFTAFEREVEHQLGQGGGLCDQRQWGAKLCGAVARIGLSMHCLETVGRGSAHSAGSAPDLSPETMGAALAWSPYLIAHERIATGIIGSDPVVAAAERVLGWLERTGLAEFSVRDCFSAVRGQFIPRAIDLDDPLRLLAELGHIRPLPRPDRTGQPGQPPSPRFEVNPLWDRGAPR
jgi:hypothetical protein